MVFCRFQVAGLCLWVLLLWQMETQSLEKEKLELQQYQLDLIKTGKLSGDAGAGWRVCSSWFTKFKNV